MIKRLRQSDSTNRHGATIIRNWENPGVIINRNLFIDEN